MKRLLPGIALVALTAVTAAALGADIPASPARVQARSKDLLAVGVVHGGKMSIHVSRFIDNAPVRDAVVIVVMRGPPHPATAETDGSYAFESNDLRLPGAATVEFQVSQGGASESLKGTLDISQAAGQPDDKNSARQLWWWVLNFAVCFGVLWLISRRRKAAKA